MHILHNKLTMSSTGLRDLYEDAALTPEDFISTDRLDIYVSHLKIRPDQVMSAYHWNKALGGALLPAIQCLEITLRNAIDLGIRSNPPPAAKGLYDTNLNWVFTLPRYMGTRRWPKHSVRYKRPQRASDPHDAQNFLLDKYGNRVLAKKLPVEVQLENVINDIARLNKQISPARVISGLSFGFWTQLLTHYYENTPGQSHNLLWPHLTATVFPNAPAGYSITNICNAFYRIKDLRNRLSHHEALWKFHYDDPTTGLPDYQNPVYGAQASCSLLRKHYDDILDMIGWMSPDRKSNFLSHSASLRFYALCSVDGLNSYIAPEKIEAKVKVSRGGKGISRLIKVLEKNDFVRIVKDGRTVLTIGPDNSILIQ